VINERGVINAFTLQPAPSNVAAGGLIWINGINLGPVEGAQAAGSPWPTELGGMRVTINNREAPLYSVSPSRIVAQVPWETPNGSADVVVRRGDAASRPGRINVLALNPAVRTKDDLGFGEAAARLTGNAVTLSVMGLGPTDPRPVTGTAGPGGAALAANVRVFVGGVPVNATASLSGERVGEYDVTFEPPASAQPGDVISVIANNAAANRAVWQRATAPGVKFLPLPANTPELRALVASDLNGNFAAANAARDADGCYASFSIDFTANRIARLPGCLTAANRNAPSPFTVTPEGFALAALVGPPQGEAPAAVSAKVMLLDPASAARMVDLPAAASNLSGGAQGNFVAVVPGQPATTYQINAITGEVTAGGAPVGGGGGGGLPGGGVNPNNLRLDLGDGIDTVASLPLVTPTGIVVLVVDDENRPTKAKLAVLNAQLQPATVRDFPSGWLPLITPLPAGPGGGGGGGIPGGGGAQNLLRSNVEYDAQTRVVFVAARKSDGSADGVIAFAQEVTALPFPAGWFHTSCQFQPRVFNLDLTRRIAYLASAAAQTAFNQNCGARGWMVLDLNTRNLASVPLPGAGEVNANSTADVSDYVYGQNLDPTRPGQADTVFVLDGASGQTFSMPVPPEINGFTNLAPAGVLQGLIALGRVRANGDAGLVLFDFESATARIFPTPDGFASVQTVGQNSGLMPSVRKLIARGLKANNAGSQLLIYDVLTGDLAMPAAPAGCTFVGTVPAAQTPGQPPAQQPVQLLSFNQKANSIVAGCFDDNRRLTGFLQIRVP
jgi:uncharacterized protein (TIGR03437 family)